MLGPWRLANVLGLADDERASLLAAVPGRGAAQPPATASPEYDLPIPSTPLLGRERELREIGGFLEEVRLLTLTGTGGVGKTRLALETARASLADRASLRSAQDVVIRSCLQDQGKARKELCPDLPMRNPASLHLDFGEFTFHAPRYPRASPVPPSRRLRRRLYPGGGRGGMQPRHGRTRGR